MRTDSSERLIIDSVQCYSEDGSNTVEFDEQVVLDPSADADGPDSFTSLESNLAVAHH